jgi:hypothetical protein
LRILPNVRAGPGVYIDLNPVAAKVVKTPETSDYTSIKQRVDHVEAQGKTAELEAASGGSVAGSQAAAGLEESLWLCPIEDRRELDSPREGMILGFSLGSYVKLVDYTGRLFAKERLRSRRSWPGFSSGWAVAPRAGSFRSRSFAGIGCWAVSSRPVAQSCGRSPDASVCVAWST